MPGLAMSRSFGDDVATSVGVSSIPEIIEINRKPDDKYIILGSDGIWEFITNEEVIFLSLFSHFYFFFVRENIHTWNVNFSLCRVRFELIETRKKSEMCRWHKF